MPSAEYNRWIVYYQRLDQAKADAMKDDERDGDDDG